MKNVFFGLALLLAVGCGSNKPSANENDHSEGAHLAWDFSKQRIFIYSYTQFTESEMTLSKEEDADKTHVDGEGLINVRVKEDGLADVSMNDLTLEFIEYDEEGNPLDTNQQDAPVTVLQNMGTNGIFADNASNIMFDGLFSLPGKELQQGESVDFPMKVPFNANGSPLFVKGQNTLTFIGYEELEGRDCAVIEGAIDISDLEVPEELKGTFTCSSTGKGTYYFDVQEGCFVGADVSLQLNALVDVAPGNAEAREMYINTTTHLKQSIRLKSIEDSTL